MDNSDVIYADPWRRNAEKNATLPEDAQFACAFELNLTMDTFHEAAYFHRTKEADELWTGLGLPKTRIGLARVFAIRRKGKELAACMNLLGEYFRARHGFERPERFVAAGIVDKDAYDTLLARLENEYEENRKRARASENELVRVARELGLSPYPPGDYPDQWAAHCPDPLCFLLEPS